MKRFLVIAGGLILSAVCTLSAAGPAETAAGLTARIPAGSMTLRDGGWFYSRSEFEHIGKGELTGKRVVEVSNCKRKKAADPAAALQNFHDQLARLGIALIIVPVPPKSAFYPPAGMRSGEALQYLLPYYEELRKNGLDILDPSVLFRQHPEVCSFCRTDAHWSPAGIRLTVDALAEKIPLRGTSDFAIRKHPVRITGDLAGPADASAKENLELETVSGNTFSEDSPVLVIGDSHTLVFSAGGDMLADHSGFCELLAAKLKMPVDRIGVRGSASSSVRIDLFRKSVRRPDWIRRKKYVIYLFSCREFTETISGWSLVPVLKK